MSNEIVPNQFHSGFMVIKPDLSTFQTMVTLIKHGDIGYAASGNNIDNEKMAYEHSIQHFLNAKIFPEWYSMPKEYRLGPKYSTPFEWTLHEYVWLSHRNQVAIIQFTPYYKPDEIIRNPAKYQTSKYATPIIYLWTLIMFFVTAPLVNLEEETRYVLHEVFGITDDSDDVIAYIKRMKRGGTRRRLGLQ